MKLGRAALTMSAFGLCTVLVGCGPATEAPKEQAQQPAATPAQSPDPGTGGTPLPDPPIEIGTGGGEGKITWAPNNGGPVTTSEAYNRLLVSLTWIVKNFKVFETLDANDSGHDALTVVIKSSGVEKATITRVGAQFHWVLSDAYGGPVIPEVCELSNRFGDAVPECSPTDSYGLPSSLAALTAVTFEATWLGQETPKAVLKITAQGKTN